MSPRPTVTHDRMSPATRHRRPPGVTLATSAGVTPASPEPSVPEPSATTTPRPPRSSRGWMWIETTPSSRTHLGT
jgi:hypothetical protein